MTLPAGARIGPYDVLSPLGGGGMGEVYRARDPRLAREVALKVLPAEVAADTGRLKRFQTEARAASALNHPNIVTIYEIGSADAVAYIAMERVEGRTLREVLFSGALPIRRALHIACQVADALAQAHEAGIVHRDLKPENVMVTKEGLAKILDFGLAKATWSGSAEEVSRLATETGTAPGAVLGTVGYMSPEQAAGQPADFRSDQFSFGALLYEMVTGKRAFQRNTPVETLSAILREDPEPAAAIRPETPAPLLWALERCLAKEPRDRYGATRDFARELVSIRDHLSVLTSGVAAPGRGVRRGARALPRAALAAILVGAGLLAGRSLWRGAPPALPRFQQLTFGGETIQTARFAPDGQTVVYGVDHGDGRVDLYSTRIGSLDYRPFGLRANVSSVSTTGELAVILDGKEKTLARVPLVGGPAREILDGVSGAAWTPDGRALAIVRVTADGRRLEYPIGRALFESKDFIGHPRFSPDARRILFPNAVSIALADLDARKVRTLTGPIGLTGCAWSPDGREIWMMLSAGPTSELRGFVAGGARRLIATFPGEFILQDVARNGRVLVERVEQRSEMVLAANEIETKLSWLDGSTPADVSPDGKAVLFTETGIGRGAPESVYLRRSDASPAVRLAEGFALALSPDGKWAITRRASDTILVPTTLGEPRPVTAAGVVFDGGATFFPDGKRMLLTGSAASGRGLYAQDVAGGEARRVAAAGVSIPEGAHTISPDGSVVAATAADGRWAIWQLGAGGETKREIRGLASGETPVRWSADGRSLFVVSETGRLSRLDVGTGRRRLWKDLPAGASVFPTPDGSAYVYGHGRTYSNLILVEGLR